LKASKVLAHLQSFEHGKEFHPVNSKCQLPHSLTHSLISRLEASALLINSFVLVVNFFSLALLAQILVSILLTYERRAKKKEICRVGNFVTCEGFFSVAEAFFFLNRSFKPEDNIQRSAEGI
jgi:hypothetical protein